jgi:hypothetical protein
VQVCFHAYPEAIQIADRYGRLPLHLMCQTHPSWDTMEFIIQEYPAALTTKDKSRHTPHALMKKCSAAMEDENVLLHSLAECTTRESRKHSRFPIFGRASSSSSSRSKKPHRKQVNGVDLYNCYG